MKDAELPTLKTAAWCSPTEQALQVQGGCVVWHWPDNASQPFLWGAVFGGPLVTFTNKFIFHLPAENMQGPAIQSWTKYPSGPSILDLLVSKLDAQGRRQEGKY